METSDLQACSGKSAAELKTDPSGTLSEPLGQGFQSTIVFDTSSGISLEEQQEILAGINAITGGSRLIPEAVVTKAKKRGIRFPLFVNIGALILLALGFVLLSHFHGQDEQDIRESSAALGVTERKLIQEIRQETNKKIGEKEKEINSILSKLSAVDAEYRVLQDSVESLTEEQQARAASLRLMQAEYRDSLSGLEDEKAKIIEDSRLQELILRSQAEERARELSSQVEQSQANLSAAMEELKLLTSEQERVARAEAQMGGYFAAVNNQIESGRLDDASASLAAMKELLNASSLQGIRSLDAKRQSHFAAIAALELAVGEARRLKQEAVSREPVQTAVQPPVVIPNDAGNDEAKLALEEALAVLEGRYTALEQKAADQEKVIAAYNSQGSEQSRIIADFEAALSELRTENTRLSSANINQQQTLNRRDAEIVNLRAENTAVGQQVAELNSGMASLQTQIQTTNNRLSENETAITSLRTQVQTANTRAQQSEAALEEQRRQNNDLIRQNSELKSQYDELQRRNEELQSIGDQMRRLLGQ